MRLTRREGAACLPFLAALGRYLEEHPKTALLIDGSEALTFATAASDLRNPSNIWWYDRLHPIPRPGEIEARRRKFIRDHRPLMVFALPATPARRAPDAQSLEEL